MMTKTQFGKLNIKMKFSSLSENVFCEYHF